jgi:hypothetical protein
MLTISRVGNLFAALTLVAVNAGEAKVLRSKDAAPTVLIFKDADALRRFGRLSGNAVQDGGAIELLLACKVPQGTNIEVLGSGHRTAFVKVIEGLAFGCEGTVPLLRVQER